MKKEAQKKDLEKIAGGRGGEDIVIAIIFMNKFLSCKNEIDAMRILNDARKLEPGCYNLFKKMVNKFTRGAVDVDKLYPPKIN